nr:GNAT family N-acetyltransferase [Motiliproteus sediminis]
MLGQEFDLAILHGRQPLAPDLLAIVAGTLAGGGVLLLDLKPEQWSGAFDRWLLRQLSRSEEWLALAEGQPLPRLAPAPCSPPPVADQHGCLGEDQRHVVAAVLQVVRGHRRRPLVVTAERGRGKSAALGIAAAILLTEGRQRVLVTAPKRAAVNTLFERVSASLPDASVAKDLIRWQQGEVRYMAPDQLLRQRPPADLLLVDEAASIPAPLLSQLLEQYARVVFCTTTQGYEGTGRGFEVRFRAELSSRTPGWRALTMVAPIRWAEGDPLEQWLYRTLMLDAEPARFDDVSSQSAPDREPLPVECWQGEALLAEPLLLRQLFALLVLAHYQTTPNDLRDLLQAPGMGVHLIRCQGQVAAAMLTLREGPLDPSLATDVWLGQRRPAGHLLPQALIAQSGWLQAANLRYQRVVRIAVHPDLQRCGLGSRLLQSLDDNADGADLLGSSFAASDHLPQFWQHAGYQPVRLGLQRDAASGAHSLLVLKPLNAEASTLVASVAARFWAQLEAQLAGAYRDLEPTLVDTLLAQQPPPTPAANQPDAPLDPQDAMDLVAYVLGGRGFEQAEPVLRSFLRVQLGLSHWRSDEKALLISRILQRHSVADCCAASGLTGRRQLEARLRQLLLPVVRQTALDLLPAVLRQRVGPLLDD